MTHQAPRVMSTFPSASVRSLCATKLSFRGSGRLKDVVTVAAFFPRDSCYVSAGLVFFLI